MADTVRRRPCASCPYRRDVPSGLWHEDEYAKLEAYDAETGEQPTASFACHQGDGKLCSGWLATHGPHDLLAVRIGIVCGTIDPSVLDYSTDVALFESGAAAAAHGRAEIDTPSAEAERAMRKITRVRALRGSPVERS